MSKLQETKDQSIQSPANEAKAHGTPLAEYIQSLFEPLREIVQLIDDADDDDWHPRLYHASIYRNAEVLEESLSSLGCAVEDRVDPSVSVGDKGELDFTFVPISGVMLGAGAKTIHEFFEDCMAPIQSMSDLINKVKDLSDFYWRGFAHVLNETINITERHLLDGTEEIEKDLGEILISGQGADVVAYVEKADEWIEAARKAQEDMDRRKQETQNLQTGLNTFLCAPCPVAAELLSGKRELPNATIHLQMKFSNGKLTGEWWTTATDDIGMTSGCLRKLLEQAKDPRWKDIELAPCPKLTDGTGTCQMTTNAGQEVQS